MWPVITREWWAKLDALATEARKILFRDIEEDFELPIFEVSCRTLDKVDSEYIIHTLNPLPDAIWEWGLVARKGDRIEFHTDSTRSVTVTRIYEVTRIPCE